MAIVLIETSSTSAADAMVSEVQSGELFGIDLGTTTTAAAYSDFVIVSCTPARAWKLSEACPDGAECPLVDTGEISFTAADISCKAWYLRGLLS